MQFAALGLIAIAIMISPMETSGRSWSTTEGNYGYLEICLDETACSTSYTSIAFSSLAEYDSDNVEGSYSFPFDGTSDELNYGTSIDSTPCGWGYCSMEVSETVLPSGGPAYSPRTNGDPYLRRKIVQVESGDVDILFGGTGYDVPSNLTEGDFIFTYEFDNWNLDQPTNTLKLTLEINTVIDSEITNTVSWGDGTSNFSELNLGNGIYLDLPNICNVGTSDESVIMMLSSVEPTVKLELTFPDNSFIYYSYSMRFENQDPSSTSADVPLSTISMFSGGFEYCAAANCSTDVGVISLAIDRLGLYPKFNSHELWYSPVVADFSLEGSIPFAPSFEKDAEIVHPLLLEIANKSIHASTNSSVLANGPANSSTIVTAVTVTKLEEEEYKTINGETVYAPAGALRVGILGFSPNNSALSTGNVGLSFFLFALEGNKVVNTIATTENGLSTLSYNFSNMYLKVPKYGAVDESVATIQSDILEFDQEIQLLFTLPPVNRTFRYEFFIGSNNIQYGDGVSENSLSEAVISLGDTHGPSKNIYGEEVPTKLLALPHGQFGLCFDSSCSSSAVKIGFSGLASTQGERLNRFADAAAFVFSEPERQYSPTGAEIWTMSFTALVPQSRVRPPIPYDSSLVGSYPTFSVRVDQYLMPGVAYNSAQKLSVPRGALKFSFNITNWVFVSDADKLTLNVTLSSIIGDAPGSETFSYSTRDNVMRLSFDSNNFIDIPLLADVDGENSKISVTAVFDPSVNGTVLVMSFSRFTNSLIYDPVMASKTIVALDLRRTPDMYNLSDKAGFILLGGLGLSVAAAITRCLRKISFRIRFSKIIP